MICHGHGCYLQQSSLSPCAWVMRANHGDEYTIAEFNPIQWTFDNSPQKKLALLAPNLRQQLHSICEVMTPLPISLNSFLL
ncbi:hypothetical protein CICLE_v10023138mg [Citrus x clementina]|uniref:Uncharacterized protein n=1 Tax=Citrus clementina TaxID=85681 RepID=V4U0X7_CITCL|nr:hypothetical protein CICLE_v10023138mg [Citrus x clementina]